jgi:hypothetical protein
MENKVLIGILIILIISISFGFYQNINLTNQYNSLGSKYNSLVSKYNDKEDFNNNINELKEKVEGIKIPDSPDCKCSSKSYCYAPETDFSLILKQNADIRQYKLNIYDCTEFSEELARRLSFQGFKAKTKIVSVDCDLWTDDWDSLEKSSGYGYKDCKDNNLHQIVEINRLYVEATTGEIILPEDYPEYNLK